MAREPRSDIARKYAKLHATNSTWGRVVFTLRARKSADTRIRLSRARRRQMNTYRRAAAALSPLHLVAQRERSARARLKEKLQNAAYTQETVKWDSNSDSYESDDEEDLNM